MLVVSGVLVAMFDKCKIKIPSNAESCEKQGGGKQYFVGQTTAELQAIFHLDVAKKIEKKLKIKDFNLAEEGNFPCKLR